MTLDSEIDEVYDYVDNLMQKGNFIELNQQLINLSVEDIGLDLALGYLTSTLPAKSRLPYRPTFLYKVKEYAQKNNLDEDGLFRGLD